ncbi:probable 2' cyclic ADP-D-ribose synthase BdTIR [Syzygium oleosum]|uniref:probable 2' cyclic ADP-D-ribose synthase BdTIR n=1 Tax=Syzygium oleosum TaxID=219896 RepID=UPI0024BBAFA3|nr:probable 2' cyclic ADP-D-ribose synthase BdTIR [Syzygium oleosum]
MLRPVATAKSLIHHHGRDLRQKIQIQVLRPTCDVFINHRGLDTKRNVSGLLYQYFSVLHLRPFLDSKTMRPGDSLFQKINEAICGCKVGVAVFSPRYCESPYCLHELAVLMENKKRLIPIFCDVRPSQLQVPDDGISSEMDLKRFRDTLDEARDTVGLTFDTSTGDWSKLLNDATDAVVRNVLEEEEERASKNP